ncbi:hypothetical protein A8135_12590 [Legionella jamestowniensis]|uniref:DUF5621 domain-containing protein n=1 Tax=Legionella jamestowniensis TaxID=455 RepID=A0ABX2XVC3_9GAMM|nr:DUF5621 domain-containing protein [Legionella jamestowniensis]OCH98382.1 hypothetical protein A8135_12590 [Legionella jamestowniensis]
MATFTTFCFGTGESRRMPLKNIISQFSEACEGDFAVFDGPSALGKEVESNSIEATRQVLKWLENQTTIDNNLNLAGFSRGSVTCIRIANELKKLELYLEHYSDTLNDRQRLLLDKLKGLKINIFANDPVAGLSDKSVIESRVIPSNVKNYVAILQRDEMRKDFKPQDMSRAIVASEQTKVSMLPMYGNHSDNTKHKSDKLGSGPKIIWQSLFSFLTQHGTQFKRGAIPQISRNEGPYIDIKPVKDSAQLLSGFEEHHAQRNDYLKSGQVVKLLDGIPVPRKKRSLNNHLEFYVRDSNFFINQLEREVFKVTYPQVFNYLFEQNQNDPRFPKRASDESEHRLEVIEELRSIREKHPKLFARLASRGVAVDRENNIILGQPHGKYMLESCQTLQQMFPGMVPDTIREQNHIFGPLERLEKDVYRMVFRYLREKSEFSPFSARSRSTLAIEIREHIQTIVNEPIKDQDNYSAEQIAQIKQEQILDYLEKEYIELVKSNSMSELCPMLKKLLHRYGQDYVIQEQKSILRSAAASASYIAFSLVKEAVGLVLNLGYIGGGMLSVIGTLLQDMGKRLSHIVGGFGSNIALNIVKAPFLAISALLQGVGFVIRQSFGLKPLAKLADDGIRFLRDQTSAAILGTEVIKTESSSPHKTNQSNESPESAKVGKIKFSEFKEKFNKVNEEKKDPLLDTGTSDEIIPTT